MALVTGHERDDKEDRGESHLDYKALAAFPGTLVFYMGVKWAGRWSGALMENGKPPDTPVAVVQWCTRARQQTVKCTLETVVEVIGEKGIRPPSLFVVGKVVDHAPTLSWFQERPLFGTSVLVAGSKQDLLQTPASVHRFREPRFSPSPPSAWRRSGGLVPGGRRSGPTRMNTTGWSSPAGTGWMAC